MKPTVYMMLGLPCSGKTTFSKQLESELGLPRFSLDEEYFDEVSNSGQAHRDFVKEKEIAETIKTRVAGLLASKQSVILDFCPWSREGRDAYRSFIESNGGIPKIYYIDIPKEQLLHRLDGRNQNADEHTQHMTPQMLDDFYERFEIPNDEVVEVVK